MYGLPEQNIEDWRESLREVVGLAPEHIGCYSVELENDSVWGRKQRQGEIHLMDETLEREMNEEADKTLTDAGYQHYEISNFAREGYQCRHNVNFWKSGEYLGLGAGASGFIEENEYQNLEDVDLYINDLEGEKSRVVTTLNEAQKQALFMIQGLRLLEGINTITFEEEFGIGIKKRYKQVLIELTKEELIEYDGKRLRLSDKGRNWENLVAEAWI